MFALNRPTLRHLQRSLRLNVVRNTIIIDNPVCPVVVEVLHCLPAEDGDQDEENESGDGTTAQSDKSGRDLTALIKDVHAGQGCVGGGIAALGLVDGSHDG